MVSTNVVMGHLQTFGRLTQCPHYARKRTSESRTAMSALGHKRTSACLVTSLKRKAPDHAGALSTLGTNRSVLRDHRATEVVVHPDAHDVVGEMRVGPYGPGKRSIGGKSKGCTEGRHGVVDPP